jgi:hypothetical protein
MKNPQHVYRQREYGRDEDPAQPDRAQTEDDSASE